MRVCTCTRRLHMRVCTCGVTAEACGRESEREHVKTYAHGLQKEMMMGLRWTDGSAEDRCRITDWSSPNWGNGSVLQAILAFPVAGCAARPAGPGL